MFHLKKKNIRHLNLEITHDDKVAIVCSSEEGKTTFIRLVLKYISQYKEKIWQV
ncbi:MULTISPECIES: hypothetical protein [unclassified Thermosipho (in: thermotogales)]|uniref:hypothetical protein n=1 Tax=unclassified Thermosipho (in: thermotogales) TaxID=2676525 RepID=UPI0009492C20|nr:MULTISPECIES: hypothetical protein [unclassified Thermosipho (in: thermotogales)]ANQ54658.1 hypothetical protein Y592_08110 [Thermosipho sp. 1070]